MSGGEGESGTGYRDRPCGGPRVRTDVVDVYVFRAGERGVEFLQLLRASDPLGQTWQPIMGHVEPGESAVQTALRELREEVGLEVASPQCLGLWALEQVHPFYIAAIDSIVMSPRFACEVGAGWTPRLNEEHTAWRWVSDARAFMWPGQKRCVEEILEEIVRGDSLSRERLRVASG
jgi:dATP pyrophosphohydrolase